MKPYEEMLETAYKKLPEKVFVKERFEMPFALVLVEGNKTIIKNFEEISNILRRPSVLLQKYLSRELAAPMNADGGRLVIQGKFRDRFLNDKIKNFADEFVLCRICGKPDTKVQEIERGIRMLVCEACGAKSPIGK